jgi:hypothetical protein
MEVLNSTVVLSSSVKAIVLIIPFYHICSMWTRFDEMAAEIGADRSMIIRLMVGLHPVPKTPS